MDDGLNPDRQYPYGYMLCCMVRRRNSTATAKAKSPFLGCAGDNGTIHGKMIHPWHRRAEKDSIASVQTLLYSTVRYCLYLSQLCCSIAGACSLICANTFAQVAERITNDPANDMIADVPSIYSPYDWERKIPLQNVKPKPTVLTKCPGSWYDKLVNQCFRWPTT
jgi:hypothetical protein